MVFAQLFLAIGWLRAAVAHGMSVNWWNGTELLNFLDRNAELANPVYAAFTSLVVEPLPVLVSLVVLVAEVGIGVLLLFNVRVREAVLAGILLNLNFILAGAVNPSIFYIMLGGVVLLVPLAGEVSSERAEAMARRAVLVSTLAAVALIPFITTIEPARVIEDPSLVLLSLCFTAVAALWQLVTDTRSAEAVAENGLTAMVTTSVEDQDSVADEAAAVAERSSRSTKPARSRFDNRQRTRQLVTVGGGDTPVDPDGAADPEGADDPDPAEGELPPADEGFTVVDVGGDPEELEEVEQLEEPEEVGGTDRDRTDRNVSRRRHGGQAAPVDPSLNWYSIRCHFKVDDERYEERITVWPAADFEGAIGQAETEARLYAHQTNGTYLESCDGFALFESPGELLAGAEVYSLIRWSKLDPDSYLEAFFFTGDETSVAL